MRKRIRLLAAGAAIAIAMPATSQQRDNAGLGTVKRSFNATEVTPGLDNLLAGIAFLNGNTFVSGGGATGVPMIYEIDAAGALVNAVPAPAASQAVGGIRDMATDGTNLIGGSDLGVFVFDTAGNLVTSVAAANGPQAIVNPIAGPGLTTVSGSFRGVAYDPNGNSGNGSLFVGNVNFTDPILEIDLAGNVLSTFANAGWSCSGLALDAITGNLWCQNDQGNGTVFSRIIELDRTNNLQPTGNGFEQDRQGPLQGGLDGIPGGDPTSYRSAFDLAVLNRLNGEDWVHIQRVHLYATLRGYDEASLEGAVNMAAFSQGALGTIGGGDTLSWRLQPGRSSNGVPAWIVFNLTRDSLTDGVTNVPILSGNPVFPELRAQNAFSSPASPFAPIVSQAVNGMTTSVTIPPGFPSCFGLIRMQAVYVEPNATPQFPFAVTNEIWANGFDEASCNVIVEAVGANSASPVPTRGFWRILHRGGPAITEVELDWGASPDPVQRQLMYFDLDQALGGTPPAFFDAGNANSAACVGTYRGSDVTTGLVYDPLNYPVNACNPGGNSGFIAEDGTNNAPGGGNSKRIIRFRFTNFSGGTVANPIVFEFDCDTDFGLGVDGASMAGLVVTFTFANGVTLPTQLYADPMTLQRSVGGL